MPSQTTPASTSVEQLKLLWSLLPHPSPEHVVRLYSRTKDGQGRVGDYARTLTELKRFVKSAGTKNVYVAPNPTQTKTGQRHSTADVTHWSYFLLDIDPVKDAIEPNPENALEIALIWLGTWWGYDFSVERPTIIDSGRGRQAWFRLGDHELDDNLTIETLSRKAARKAMGYWLNRVNTSLATNSECQVDTSTSDLPRLMRCPGTLNQKTGRMARIVEPGQQFPGLAQKLIELTPATVFAEPDVSEVIPGRTWQMAFQDLTKTAQQYLLHGMEEGGRHKAVFSTARKLCEVGVSIDEARKGIRRANKLNGPDSALGLEEIENALKTAYNVA